MTEEPVIVEEPTDEDVPEPEKRPKAKRELRLPVRLLDQREGSALVQWIDEEGMYRRAYVPPECVKDGMVASNELAMGIPYGLPWEQWIEVLATPERIANELRRHGVWCWSDLNHAALNAVNKAFDQGAFLRLVDQEVNQ